MFSDVLLLTFQKTKFHKGRALFLVLFTDVSQTPRKQDFAYIRQLTVDEVISEYVVISVEKVGTVALLFENTNSKSKTSRHEHG